MKLFYNMNYIVLYLYRNIPGEMFMAFFEHQEVQV